MESKLALAAITYCIVRECYFLYTINKLLNKLMSRNFYDYRISENAGKMESKSDSVTVNEDYNTDMDALKEF